MVLTAGSCWGLSGTVAQKLFTEYGFTPGSLVTIRLLAAGLMMLMIGFWRGKSSSIRDAWKTAQGRVQIVVFGLLGMLGVQYTYFASIGEGNAATATLLQYLAPLMITVYLSLRAWKMPDSRETGAVLLALLGTMLLVTNGDFHQLSVPGSAVFWGLLSAVALAFYTLYPAGLLQRLGSEAVVGWGMVVGGIGLMPIFSPWHWEGQIWNMESVFLISFVILFGTLLAFFLYLDSMRYITPTEASLLACVEPMVAVVASVFWLGVPFGFLEALGGLCIIATVTILSLKKAPVPAS
jgi:drug/metabolite transporter (DMT)-like permease